MDWKSAVMGAVAFVLAVLFTVASILGYQQYRLTQELRKVVVGQCQAVEQQVIDRAVQDALERRKDE